MNKVSMTRFHRDVRRTFDKARNEPLIVTFHEKEMYVVVKYDTYLDITRTFDSLFKELEERKETLINN